MLKFIHVYLKLFYSNSASNNKQVIKPLRYVATLYSDLIQYSEGYLVEGDRVVGGNSDDSEIRRLVLQYSRVDGHGLRTSP